MDHRRGFAFTFAVCVLKPILVPLTVRHWLHGERIPPAGGVVVVINHISHVDPLLSAHFLYDQGRLPHYLAKASLFRNRFLASFLRGAGQIPVERLTSKAVGAYDEAVRALGRGECVVIYPEGTLTRDPDLWPMRGKTGAARIALATGAPVVPIGQWGAQELLAPYSRRPRLLPRTHVWMKVGEPVDLADLRAPVPSPDDVAAATDRIMAAITALVSDLRGEQAPEARFDPVAEGVSEIGNPHRDARNHVTQTQPDEGQEDS